MCFMNSNCGKPLTSMTFLFTILFCTHSTFFLWLQSKLVEHPVCSIATCYAILYLLAWTAVVV